MCLTQSTPIIFLSTPSARRATIYGHQSGRDCHISIHALREEGDLLHFSRISPAMAFLSTPSAWRATSVETIQAITPKDFYPRPPRGGRQALEAYLLNVRNFYPRPPRGGRRCLRLEAAERRNFYPRPPRGGRPALWMGTEWPSVISIHALREEGDSTSCWVRILRWRFLSTPSARRATIGIAVTMTASLFLSTPSARRATGMRAS